MDPAHPSSLPLLSEGEEHTGWHSALMNWTGFVAGEVFVITYCT